MFSTSVSYCDLWNVLNVVWSSREHWHTRFRPVIMFVLDNYAIFNFRILCFQIPTNIFLFVVELKCTQLLSCVMPLLQEIIIILCPQQSSTIFSPITLLTSSFYVIWYLKLETIQSILYNNLNFGCYCGKQGLVMLI